MAPARPVNAGEAQIQAVSVEEHPVVYRAWVITSRCDSGYIPSFSSFGNFGNLLHTLEGLPSLERRPWQAPKIKPRQKKLCGTS